jgi:hypothetical protein
MKNKKTYKRIKWRRFLHPRKARAVDKLKDKYQHMISSAREFIDEIGYVNYPVKDPQLPIIIGVESLLRLVELHKEIWKAGFQNDELGPNPTGTFRTYSIETMVPEEVFLGFSNGLGRKNIPFWEEHKDNYVEVDREYPIYNYLTAYQVVLLEYKDILTSNIERITKELQRKLKQLNDEGY